MPTPPPPPPLDAHLLSLIQLAVDEDLGTYASGGGGDKTVQLAIPHDLAGTATLVARKPGVLAGVFLLRPLLDAYPRGAQVSIGHPLADGTRLTPGQPVATLSGPVQTLLSAERVLLNFLGHLSGIATLTRTYADTIAHAVPDAQRRPALCDTRKTTPGFRILDKFAVACGGGTNHRLGLYDGIMLKDNHLAALKEKLGAQLSLAELAAHLRKSIDPGIQLWLEVDTLQQLKEALPGGGADIILLDNFTPPQLRDAVQLRNQQGVATLLEASGGITLATLPEIAQTGIDRLSVGALTHSAPVLDLALDWND